MDDGRNDEGDQLNNNSSFAKRIKEAIKIEVHVVIKPIMNDDVPLPIVWAKLKGVPPVRIKRSIRETGNLSPKIEPTVEETKETKYQKENCRKHEIADCNAKSREVKVILKVFYFLFDPCLIKNKSWIKSNLP